jgi:hypothetical protein
MEDGEVEENTNINVLDDAPPNSLRDPNVGPKTKQQKKKKIRHIP